MNCSRVIFGRAILLFFLTILCVACSSEKAGLRELKKLCEKDAGLTVYKTVEADGFYNSHNNNGITQHLIKGDFSFYEFCDYDPSKLNNTMFPDPGCFKVRKVARGVTDCDERVEAKLAMFTVSPYPEFMEDQCISVEVIDRPTARYRYEVETIDLSSELGAEGELSKGVARVIDSKTQKILGESINYVWYSSERGLSGFRDSIHCGSGEVTGLSRSKVIGEGVLQKVLIAN
ncbi:MAG: hypothetical protein GYB33_02440 [Gammaproteobacteria bacterium]|nr:hypothetical protein [Gammaproteobacteria bacterium]